MTYSHTLHEHTHTHTHITQSPDRDDRLLGPLSVSSRGWTLRETEESGAQALRRVTVAESGAYSNHTVTSGSRPESIHVRPTFPTRKWEFAQVIETNEYATRGTYE